MAENLEKDKKSEKENIIKFYHELFTSLTNYLIEMADLPKHLIDDKLHQSLKNSYEELKNIIDTLIAPPQPEIPEIPEEIEKPEEPVHGEPYELPSEIEAEDMEKDLEPIEEK